MQIEGVSAVSVSTGASPQGPLANTDINSPTAVGNSDTSPNSDARARPNKLDEEQQLASGAPKPLKGMATTDFLSLHNMYNDQNVMNKLLKILEAVLALKLLDETLEAVQESREGSNFKEIA